MIMKKMMVIICLVGFSTLACGDEKEKVVTKETIVVPEKRVVPEEKNTTISLDKNGVKVSTKKVDVSIEPDKKKN